MSRRIRDAIYEKVTERPGYKPIRLTLSATQRGNFSIVRQVFGPRGGVLMEEFIELTPDEWRELNNVISTLPTGPR